MNLSIGSTRYSILCLGLALVVSISSGQKGGDSATSSSSADTASNSTGSGTTATICYMRGESVCLNDESFKKERKLVKAKNVSDPHISPDGKLVAVTDSVDKGDNFERHIALLVASTGKLKRVTGVDGTNNYGPIWSPDGKWLMLHHYTDRRWDAAIVNADGGGFRVLSGQLKDDTSVYPAWWAADSASVYLYDFKNVYQVDLKGKELQRKPLKQLLGDAETASGYTFALMPGGKEVVFEALFEAKDIKVEEGVPSVLFQVPVDFSAKPRRVSPAGMNAREPACLVDGTILFHGDKGKEAGIFEMKPGEKMARLVVPKATNVSASLSTE